MKIVFTIVADCDVPPSDDYMQMHGDELNSDLEDAVASFLLSAGASLVSVDARIDA